MALPKDALKFAKQMGIDMKGLEAEAEDIWSMLNDMSEKNFDEYQSFIQQQFKEQKEAETAASEGKEKDDTKFIRPIAGFAVETTTLSGDGVKVRQTDASGAPMGKVMYVNVCSHEAVEQPMDYNGGRIAGNWTTTADLQIPLVIGPTRDLEENTKMAVDALVNISVIERCVKQPSFKSQLVELVFASIMDERGVKLKPSWTAAPSTYLGGRGAEKTTPVLFPIPSNPASSTTGKDSASADVANKALQTPTMLLGALKQERDNQEERTHGDIILQRSNPLSSKQVQFGASVGGGGAVASPRVVAKDPTPAAAAAPLLKKGFLNEGGASKRPSLYPEGGSSEGQGGDKGGAFQRLMNRCQVVDASTMSASQPPPPPPQAAQQPVIPSNGGVGGGKARPNPVPTRDEMLEMEKLLGKADSEWSSSNAGSGLGDDGGGDFTKALEEMSKMLLGSSLDISPPPSFVPPSPPHSTLGASVHAQDVVVSGKLFAQGNVKIEESVFEGAQVLEIVISSLANLDFGRDVTIDVGKSEMNVTIRGDVVKIVHKRLAFDASSASAASKKKTQQLRIKVRLVE